MGEPTPDAKPAARVQSILTGALLAFVAASLAFLVVKDVRQRRQATPGDTGELQVHAAGAARPSRIVGYYFRTAEKCSSCERIEAWSHEAIRGAFAPALAGGRLIWRVVDYEQPANRHFIQDYGLYTKSVVVVEFRDGRESRSITLDKLWRLLHDKPAFQRYIREQVEAYLGGADG